MFETAQIFKYRENSFVGKPPIDFKRYTRENKHSRRSYCGIVFTEKTFPETTDTEHLYVKN